MNCRHYKNELIETVRLASKLKPELSNHLLLCAACREFFESQNQLSKALKMVQQADLNVAPRASLQQQLLQSIRNPSNHRTDSNFWVKSVAAIVIAVLCGSIWIYQKEYRQNQSEKKHASVESQTWSGYVPLTYGMAPGESLQRVRVKLPRSALNDFGIAVQQPHSDEITADVIVGESGVPYAIRVIQQSN